MRRWIAVGLLLLGTSATRGAGFRAVPPEVTGIRFTNHLSEARGLADTIVNNGSGVACGDIDGDGRTDLFFCALEGGAALYRNLGDWRFTNVTVAAGLTVTHPSSTGAVLADVDGDDDLDLLVGGIGTGVRWYANDGRGRFQETPDAGLVRRYAAMSMALADADGDGDLDLYVANYRTTTIMDRPGVRFAVRRIQGRLTVTRVDGVPAEGPEWEGRFYEGPGGALREAGEPDVFYRNEGGGRFREVSWTDGTFLDEDGKPLTDPPRDWGLSVVFRDFDGDGDPDLYVCNDSDSPDRMWINDGQGRFRLAPRWALRHTSLSSMGIDVADVNRDGLDDFLVLDMLARRPEKRLTQLEKSRPVPLASGDLDARPQVPRNTLQIRRPDGAYAELAFLAGLSAADWAWSPIFLDVDLDGYEDLLVANGFHREVEDIDVAERQRAAKAAGRVGAREELAMRAWFPKWETPNAAFRNRGDLTFEDVSAAWGFDAVGVSQGMALADLDGDGDLDVVMNNLNAGPGLFRNEAEAPRVAVRLRGQGANTRGIGARLRLFGEAMPEQRQEMMAGGRYLSGDEALRVFAAGSATQPLRLEVLWRSGRRSVVPGVTNGPPILVVEPTAASEPEPEVPRPVVAGFGFEDRSALLAHRHEDRVSGEASRQPLLSRRIAQMGPGLAWCDLDGNGLEDMLVGASGGDAIAVRLNLGPEGFRTVELPPLSAPPSGDVAGLLAWPTEPGRATLLWGIDAGVSTEPVPAVMRRELFFGQAEDSVAAAGNGSGVGPLAAADVDGDGDLDLFVGGRVVADRYPLAASSQLLRFSGGRWSPDAVAAGVLREIGLVRGAVWTDLDSDGFPELVLACEWGPVKILRNREGRLEPWDPEVALSGDARIRRLSDLTGWWTGIGAGDFDGDGHLDLVAGNWGLNTRYQEFLRDEIRVRYGDLDGNGTWEVIESGWDPVRRLEFPWIDGRAFRAAVPSMAGRFATHREYAAAGVPALLGDAAGRVRELRVRVLDSMVFLRRGDRFEARPLPAEAQWAPVFGVCVGDANGDGQDDLFLAQNFFGNLGDEGRLDAGEGLWLAGDGRGGWRPVAGGDSGVRVFGDQRGAALADFDGDGRVDLAVAQNGAETRLFRNHSGRPGLRVRLSGPAGNPAGFGAVVRVGHGERWGPARELHAGAGYWSQDSPVLVMAGPEGEARVQVRWPGGRTTIVTVPAGVREVTVRWDG